ncbi:MAG: hypothetical protein ACI4PQ_07635 [Butyricicoccaceae bacterium]
MNPMALMQLKAALAKFKHNHPKFLPFLSAVKDSADAGTIIDITVTTSNGRTIHSKTKLTADDIDTLKQLSQLNT